MSYTFPRLHDNYICLVCAQLFEDRNFLLRHYVSHHTDGDLKYVGYRKEVLQQNAETSQAIRRVEQQVFVQPAPLGMSKKMRSKRQSKFKALLESKLTVMSLLAKYSVPLQIEFPEEL